MDVVTRAGLAAALLLVLAAVTAANVRALPDFPLIDTGGSALSSTGAAKPGRWLLLYVQAGCRPCDALLASIKKEKHPNLPAAIVIVVGAATPDEAVDLRAKFPELAAATWYADPSLAGYDALKLTGLPVVGGLDAGRLEWTHSGAPNAALQSLLSGWVVERPRPPGGN